MRPCLRKQQQNPKQYVYSEIMIKTDIVSEEKNHTRIEMDQICSNDIKHAFKKQSELWKTALDLYIFSKLEDFSIETDSDMNKCVLRYHMIKQANI